MTKPAWVSFVRVSNIEQSVNQARGLGGDVVLTPSPDVLDGKVAIINDPLGASVGIMDWQYSEIGVDQPQ